MMTSIDLNAGALAPVADEVDVFDLKVSGTLPSGLNGTLLRNGPNPFAGRFSGTDMLAWWVSSAMVHGLSISDGRAEWYRNRWVHTAHLDRHRGDALPSDPWRDHNPNVNVIAHGGRTLALGEGGLPFELGLDLTTAGPTTFDSALTATAHDRTATPTGMTAHPKIDPTTGELVFFRADWQPPHLRYGVIGPDGAHRVDLDVELDAPTMMHDFAITETKALFLDLNVGFDFTMLQHGAAMPLRWDDTKTARIGVMNRTGGSVAWHDITPCFIQHVVNAYDADATTVVFDAVRYDRFLDFDDKAMTYRPNPLGTLWRYTLATDPITGASSVHERQIDDRHVEMPRIDERRTGRRHRYAYTVAQPSDVEMRGIVRFDLETGSTALHHVPPHDQNSEPIFVPDAAGTEDEGWVLACVYRAESDTTDVIVLDATDVAADPVATVHLPRRIPAGFHGAWVPNAAS